MSSIDPKSKLRVEWCTHAAAKYAVEHWHYSKSLPPGPMVYVGAWESGVFVGSIVFGRGANKNLGVPYGLRQTECCELVRIALQKHCAPVSQILSYALKLLRKSHPNMRLIVSFADPEQGHHGGVYQATGWIYAGQGHASYMYRDKSGKLWHPRLISPSGIKKAFGKYRKVYKPSDCERISVQGKHRYLMPLDKEMKQKVLCLSKPYPKRAGSADSGTPSTHLGGGGANPTPALHK